MKTLSSVLMLVGVVGCMSDTDYKVNSCTYSVVRPSTNNSSKAYIDIKVDCIGLADIYVQTQYVSGALTLQSFWANEACHVHFILDIHDVPTDVAEFFVLAQPHNKQDELQLCDVVVSI